MAVIQLTSPLILANDPTLALHPVTKRYADGKISALDAWGFTSGVLNVARIPEFLGDVTKPAGDSNVTLTPTGVVAGTYTKITVSPSGRVISGGPLTPADIPAMNWTKIASGKPNTLAGYGITDALTAAGGMVTGDMSLTATPVNNYHMVNKSYVDASIVPGGDSIVVGDITRMAITSTPTGFLRANGGKVSKTTYAALYSMIGDRFELLLNLDTGTVWRHQAGVKLPGDIIGGVKFSNFPSTGSASLINDSYPRHYQGFVIKNKLYMPYVGSNGGYPLPVLLSSDILPNGDVGPLVAVKDKNLGWMPLGNDIECFVIKNKFYHISGTWSSGQPMYWGELRRCNVNSDGTLGDISIVYSDLNRLKPYTRFCQVKDRLYVFDYWFSPMAANSDTTGIGGPVEYGYFSVNTNGDLTGLTNLGSFQQGVDKRSMASASFSGAVLDAFVMKEKLIVIAGNQSGECSTYYASINSDGSLSTWTKGVALASNTNINSRMVVTTQSAYLVYGVDHLYRLNFDGAGIPVSWNSVYVGGPLISSQIGVSHGLARPLIVKNRLYITTSFHGGWQFPNAYFDFTGGLNDYTQYQDGSLSQPDPLNFFLPDFTSKETAGTKYYIKT